MKKLTITAPDEKIGAIINALAGAYTTLVIETVDTAPEILPPKKKRIVHRHAFVREAVLALHTPDRALFSRAEIVAAIVAANGAASSASATISQLVGEGRMERVSKDNVRFKVAAPP